MEEDKPLRDIVAMIILAPIVLMGAAVSKTLDGITSFGKGWESAQAEQFFDQRLNSIFEMAAIEQPQSDGHRCLVDVTREAYVQAVIGNRYYDPHPPKRGREDDFDISTHLERSDLSVSEIRNDQNTYAISFARHLSDCSMFSNDFNGANSESTFRLLSVLSSTSVEPVFKDKDNFSYRLAFNMAFSELPSHQQDPNLVINDARAGYAANHLPHFRLALSQILNGTPHIS